jgi:hypothetical protein
MAAPAAGGRAQLGEVLGGRTTGRPSGDGEHPLDLYALTTGTLDQGLAPDEELEVSAAVAAVVFVDRHSFHFRLKISD